MSRSTFVAPSIHFPHPPPVDIPTAIAGTAYIAAIPMFGILVDALTLTLSTLLPTFLTYKALSLPPSSQNTSALHPWLTYWITNSLVLAFPRILPFDSYLRLGAHIYLLVPGRAEAVYQNYLRPWLQEHETQIEETVERIHDQGKNKAWEVLRTVRELLVGKLMGDPEAVKRKELEEEEKRREMERQRLGMGFVQSLLQRWSSASSVQEAKAERHQAGNAPGELTLATKLGGLVSTAAAAGVDRLQAAVAVGENKAATTTSFSVAPGSSVPTSHTGSVAMEHSMAGLSKSRSEVDFEKIEQEEAPASETLAKQQAGAGWTTWLWNSKPVVTVAGTGKKEGLAKSSGSHSKSS